MTLRFNQTSAYQTTETRGSSHDARDGIPAQCVTVGAPIAQLRRRDVFFIPFVRIPALYKNISDSRLHIKKYGVMTYVGVSLGTDVAAFYGIHPSELDVMC